jgi:solute carrier family 26, other
VAIILSLITIVILVINNEILKPKVAKKMSLPIPIELIAVIGGTLISKYMQMHENWDIILVGEIPTGLPDATFPKLTLWRELLMDSFAIAFVSYSVTVSMALIFGQKLKYEINFNQELLAMVTI